MTIRNGSSPEIVGSAFSSSSACDVNRPSQKRPVTLSSRLALLAMGSATAHKPAEENAFYYARVIEIPTPRWIVYDKVRLGAKLPKDAKLIHQERAYTSPIWYNPKG